MTGATANCRLCGPSEFSDFAVIDGFCLQRCRQCSLVQITDDLSNVNLEDYYDQKFFDETYDWLKEAKGRQKEYRKFDYRLEEIEKLKPGKGKILDLGCSFGFFLDVARGRGWNAVGVEVGEYAAKFVRDKLDLDVHTGDLMDVDLPADHFEAVTLWNVLEHLDDPVAQLMRINGLMKTGGVFVLTTGDIDSYIRKVEGLRWRALIPPIHVANYSVAAVTRLLELTGFSLWVRSVALPREALLKKIGVIGLLKALRFSDKMMIFARKDRNTSGS